MYQGGFLSYEPRRTLKAGRDLLNQSAVIHRVVWKSLGKLFEVTHSTQLLQQQGETLTTGGIVNLTSQTRENRKQNRNLYFCELEFVEDILGAQPKTEKVLRNHLEAKFRREAAQAEKKGLTPPSEERREEIIQNHLARMFSKPLEDTIEEESKYAHTCFFQDEFGPWLGDYAFNACFREMMVCLGISSDPKRRGVKQTFQHLMCVRGCDEEGNLYEDEQMNRIHFYRDGELVGQADDYLEMTGNVSTPQGKMSIIKRHDRILHATIRFVIDVPANLGGSRAKCVLKDEDIINILGAAETNGLGACRSMSHGRFTVLNLERLTNVPYVQGGKTPNALAKEGSKPKEKVA